ncbi:MAG: hypothetical protein ACR2QV_03415 [Gammaproteobacteria bacterium]
MKIPSISTSTMALGLLALLTGGHAAANGGAHVICTPQPVVCTSFNLVPDDRFDPFVQHLLVRQQIQALPLGAQITNLYVPYVMDKRNIEEIQIRYLDELRRRQAAEEAAAAQAEAEPPAEGE